MSKAIEIKPDFVDAYYNRGGTKFVLYDYRGAIQDFSKVIEIDPKLAHAYNARAESKYQLNDYRGAIQDYNKVIELKTLNL